MKNIPKPIKPWWWIIIFGYLLLLFLVLREARLSPNWAGFIAEGKPILVRFDTSFQKFDDSSFTGSWMTDPMGNIKGGEDYVVVFSEDYGWQATGYNEETYRILTSGCPADSASPFDYQICIWGRIYTFNDGGEIFDSEYGHVGHLVQEIEEPWKSYRYDFE